MPPVHSTYTRQICSPDSQGKPSVTTKSPHSTQTSYYQSISVSTVASLPQPGNPHPIHKSIHVTTTKISTQCPSTHTHACPSAEQCRPLTKQRQCSLASKYLPLHFLKRQIRQVRHNTFLSRCQPPWPPSSCHNQTIRFISLRLGRLSTPQVHPSSHPMLTTVCPLATNINNHFQV